MAAEFFLAMRKGFFTRGEYLWLYSGWGNRASRMNQLFRNVAITLSLEEGKKRKRRRSAKLKRPDSTLPKPSLAQRNPPFAWRTVTTALRDRRGNEIPQQSICRALLRVSCIFSFNPHRQFTKKV